MIEAVVSKVITSKLKKYIEKVKGSQTQMKLWKGSASFDNLTLKATALSNHDLPLVIKKGTIGHVNVAFPWKALNTEPCIVEVSDVFIIANLDEEILVRKELETVKTDESAGNEKAKKKQRKERSHEQVAQPLAAALWPLCHPEFDDVCVQHHAGGLFSPEVR